MKFRTLSVAICGASTFVIASQAEAQGADSHIIGTQLRFDVANSGAAVANASASQTSSAVTTSSAAASDPPDSENWGEEIVVTAQGREQRLKDVPVSVSVTQGVTLTQLNLNNLEEVTSRLPSVRIAPAPLTSFITIRGVGSSLNPGFEQSVGTFVDGLYRGRARSTQAALFDIDRIEVLKGPQTTFFGNNTIAGALNITTRKPGRVFEANGSAYYSPAFGEYSAEAGVSIPLTDTFSARLSGRASGMDGYITNNNLGRKGPNLNDQIGRASVVWTPSDAIEINARVDVVSLRDLDQIASGIYDCPPDPTLGPPAGGCARFLAFNNGIIDDAIDYETDKEESYHNYDMVEALFNARISLGGPDLILNTGYFWHKSDLLDDVLPVPAQEGGSVVGTSNGFLAHFLERFHQFSQEIRLQSQADAPVGYTIGAYYSRSDLQFDALNGFYFAPFGLFSGGQYNATTPVATRILNQETSETLSFFAAATINLTEQFRANLGLRYTQVSKNASRTPIVGTAGFAELTVDSLIPGNATTQQNIGAVLGIDPGQYDNPSRTDKKVMPAASLQYDITPDIMMYASYTMGFKAGGYSVQFNKSSFDPEVVDAFEIGAKAALLDNRLNLNIALFHGKYKDLQESTTIRLDSGSVRQIVGNVAATTARGVEVSASLMAAPGLTFTTDVSYLDAIYDRYPGAACTARQQSDFESSGVAGSCTQDLSGKRRAFAPKWSGNFGVTYSTPVGEALRATLSANVYFSSKFFQQPIADPIFLQPGYAKVDARLAFGSDDGRWEVAIVGKNLTNKLTANYRQISTAKYSFQALPERPRSVGFQIALHYK